jgi:hypothetical protein
MMKIVMGSASEKSLFALYSSSEPIPLGFPIWQGL